VGGGVPRGVGPGFGLLWSDIQPGRERSSSPGGQLSGRFWFDKSFVPGLGSPCLHLETATEDISTGRLLSPDGYRTLLEALERALV